MARMLEPVPTRVSSGSAVSAGMCPRRLPPADVSRSGATICPSDFETRLWYRRINPRVILFGRTNVTNAVDRLGCDLPLHHLVSSALMSFTLASFSEPSPLR